MTGHKNTSSFSKDIFRSGVVWPNEVVILATGPNGISHYKDIGDRFTVAVNKAQWIARECGMHTDVWMCSTPYYVRYENDWWIEALEYAREIGTKIVFDWQLCATIGWDRVDYSYYQHGTFEDKLDPGAILGGGTISSIAVQAHLQLAVDPHNILVGADMFGHCYADGGYSRHKSDEPWGEIDIFQRVINYAKRHATVVSWSRTNLEVDVVSPRSTM